MPVIKMALILVLVLLPPSCGPWDFLNPLYTKKDLVSDPLLLGTWMAKGNDETDLLEFGPAEGGCYALKYTNLPTGPEGSDGPKHMDFDACLVKLGRMVLLDVQPKAVPVGATTETFHLATSTGLNPKASLSPGLFYVEGSGDRIVSGLFVTLAPTDGTHNTGAQTEYEMRLTPAHGIFRVWIRKKKLWLSHFHPDGDVATLTTKELQKLVLKYADARFFWFLWEFTRKNGGSR